MTATYREAGNVIDYTNGGEAAIAMGDVVVLGTGRVGIAITAIPVGETGAVQTEGVFAVPKTADLEIAAGDLLYFNATTGITKTNTDVPAGWAVEAAAAADTECMVKLLG